MVPRFRTALTGPLHSLEQAFLRAAPEIEAWFRVQWQQTVPPFYCSVDLRNAGFKLAPVDTNLFPGGFNNLNPDFDALCVQAIMQAVERFTCNPRRLLLIPENHTRNQFYLQNVARLVHLFRQAGLVVRVGSLLPEITAATVLPLPDGQSLTLEPVRRQDNHLFLGDYEPCAILLNNDLSAGVPEILRGLEQELAPPLAAGWSTRRKSQHFAHYQQVAQQFSQLLQIDPWLVDPYFAQCGQIDFQERQGEDCLAHRVENMLQQIASKYKEYGVSEKPFVIVKADAGTYGMGVMTIRDPSEVVGLNRKQRNKMAVGKEGVAVTEVLIQEGVYTFETLNEAIAEPVVYMIDRFVVGGFYRVHTGRGRDENLNAPGMHFVPLAFESPCQLGQEEHPNDLPNRFYSYGVVARLALLAATRELAATGATSRTGTKAG